MKGLRLLKDLYNNPTVRYHVKRAGRKLGDKLETRSPGYKKKEAKIDKVTSADIKKIAKKQGVPETYEKLSDKDYDRIGLKIQRIEKRYKDKRPKIFDKLDQFNKGGVVRGAGASIKPRKFKVY